MGAGGAAGAAAGSALLISVPDAKDGGGVAAAASADAPPPPPLGYQQSARDAHSSEPMKWQRLRRQMSLQAEREARMQTANGLLRKAYCPTINLDAPSWSVERGSRLLQDMHRDAVIHYKSEVYLERKRMQWKFGPVPMNMAMHPCCIPTSIWCSLFNICTILACLLTIFALVAAADDESRELSAHEWIIPLLIIGVSACLPSPMQAQIMIQQVSSSRLALFP